MLAPSGNARRAALNRRTPCSLCAAVFFLKPPRIFLRVLSSGGVSSTAAFWAFALIDKAI